jgi:hypothetical protein
METSMLTEKIAIEELLDETLPEERPLPASPLVVSYGMGVDSTAVLVGLHQRGLRPERRPESFTGKRYEVVFGDGYSRGADTLEDAIRIARNARAEGDANVSVFDVEADATVWPGQGDKIAWPGATAREIVARRSPEIDRLDAIGEPMQFTSATARGEGVVTTTEEG